MMADLNTLAEIGNGTVRGHNAKFDSVSSDSRAIDFNALFVALKGPNFDGNKFVIKAQEAGAAAALVSEYQDDALINQVLVKDTLLALQTFAANWRSKFNLPVIGVTGSNGKTTTKTMLKEIFLQKNKVHVTQGNLNNEIGVPLTLLKLNADHQTAIIEMGANHKGEIAMLADMVKPDIGLITNTSDAHLEGFGDFEGVVRAKGELFAALPKDGIAIINAESRGSLFLSQLTKHCEKISFGFHSTADVQVKNIDTILNNNTLQQVFTLRTPDWQADIEMNLLGKHNALNAAAAASVAYACGLETDDVVRGLQGMHAVAGRFNVQELGSGGYLIDDCYNANPASMRAAITTAIQLKQPVWFVMGDMFEMGDAATQHHAAVGEFAKKSGVQRLYACGEHAQAATQAFGRNAKWFANKEELGMHLNQVTAAVADPVTILIKASRGMHFEYIVKELSKHFIEATGQFRRIDSAPKRTH